VIYLSQIYSGDELCVKVCKRDCFEIFEVDAELLVLGTRFPLIISAN